MKPESIKRIGVLTSGGDAPGMNAAIRAVVRCGVNRNLEVFGVRSGYQGLCQGDFVPLGPRSVSNLIQQGGTFLGTSRSDRFLEETGRTEAAMHLRDHDIDGLVIIGGNGSFRGAQALHREHGIAVIGVPGTIDNDIGGTDFTIGFDTAVNTAIEAIDRLRDTAFSLDRAFFVEVMGRRSGAIAVATGLAGGAEGVLIPEREDELPRLIENIREARELGKNSIIVVVAEGAALGGAQAVADKVTEVVPIRVRVSILGYIQRGGRPTAADRILGSRLGGAAVDALRRGETSRMTCIRGGQVETAPLEDAWTLDDPPDHGVLELCRILAQ